jgi:hypothetical protein
LMPAHQIPYFYVSPGVNRNTGETTGYWKRDIVIEVTLVVNAVDFYNPTVPEQKAKRVLVGAMDAVIVHFMKVSNRRLDFLPDVRVLNVADIDYNGDLTRGGTRLLAATAAITVEKQYPKVA